MGNIYFIVAIQHLSSLEHEGIIPCIKRSFGFPWVFIEEKAFIFSIPPSLRLESVGIYSFIKRKLQSPQEFISKQTFTFAIQCLPSMESFNSPVCSSKQIFSYGLFNTPKLTATWGILGYKLPPPHPPFSHSYTHLLIILSSFSPSYNLIASHRVYSLFFFSCL